MLEKVQVGVGVVKVHDLLALHFTWIILPELLFPFQSNTGDSCEQVAPMAYLNER
jgi:hypothetical protein